MKTMFVFSFCLLSIVYSLSSVSYAAEKKAEAPAPIVESDAAKDLKSLQAQEQWVARLKKQTDGEVRQLSEMRQQIALKYKLDVRKFEAGEYTYDEAKNVFVERN